MMHSNQGGVGCHDLHSRLDINCCLSIGAQRVDHSNIIDDFLEHVRRNLSGRNVFDVQLRHDVYTFGAVASKVVVNDKLHTRQRVWTKNDNRERNFTVTIVLFVGLQERFQLPFRSVAPRAA